MQSDWFSIISQIEHYIFYSADRIADPQLSNDSPISFDQKKDMVLDMVSVLEK